MQASYFIYSFSRHTKLVVQLWPRYCSPMGITETSLLSCQQKALITHLIGRDSFVYRSRTCRVTKILPAEEGKILNVHIRYNKGPVNLLFPKRKSKYITILRHPINQFESTWGFYKFTWAEILGLENDNNPILNNYSPKAK